MYVNTPDFMYCRQEFVCDKIFLQRFANVWTRKKYDRKNFNGHTVIIVVMNFRKNFLIAKNFH